MRRRFNETLVAVFPASRRKFSSLARKKIFPREEKNEVAILLNASAPIHLPPPHKYPLNPQINNLLKNILKVFVDFCGELWGIV